MAPSVMSDREYLRLSILSAASYLSWVWLELERERGHISEAAQERMEDRFEDWMQCLRLDEDDQFPSGEVE